MGVLPKNWAVKGARRSGLITLVVFLATAAAAILLTIWSHQAWPPVVTSVLILTPGLYLAWKLLPDERDRSEGARHSAALDADPPLPAVAVPRQLPTGVTGFTGRVAELKKLTGWLDEAALPGGTVVISAINGMGGIGKTALAVQWAYQVADRFPDGQLYVNLCGSDPVGPPVTPAEAIRGFLDALEVPAARIPVNLDHQAALYRSLLAGRRMLALLDNARDADQVRPLLPGSPGCGVLVTSRYRLTSLIAEQGAHPLNVDLFPPADAREMLVSRLGAERVTAYPQAVEQIITQCDRLPLALSIVAAPGHRPPGLPADSPGRRTVRRGATPASAGPG
jgi:hypothetical protein